VHGAPDAGRHLALRGRADGQRFSAAERFVTGLRNSGGVAVDSTGVGIYATQHGRDQLAENWPALYKPAQGANLPAEELVRIERGADYGWPECYFDDTQQKLVLAPEYGGDGFYEQIQNSPFQNS